MCLALQGSICEVDVVGVIGGLGTGRSSFDLSLDSLVFFLNGAKQHWS